RQASRPFAPTAGEVHRPAYDTAGDQDLLAEDARRDARPDPRPRGAGPDSRAAPAVALDARRGAGGADRPATTVGDQTVKFRVLVIVCAAVVALSCFGFALLPAPASWHLGWFATLFSYTAAVAGAAIGASSFGRGDRLRWAWLLVASYAVIGLGKVILWGPPRHVGPALGLWPHSLTPLTGAISTIGLNV